MANSVRFLVRSGICGRAVALSLRDKPLFSRCKPFQSQLRWFGQPVAQTHPHLIQEGHVTPGITVQEYRSRRHRLMEKVSEVCKSQSYTGRNIMIIPSASKAYMSHEIPYPFRQNTDFLYLCGFLEPDSILVLEADGKSLPEHRSILFVPKRDPHRELWDGPRSGAEGAYELTGVDEAYNIEDFDQFFEDFIQENHRHLWTWYDFKKPAHVDFHAKYIAKALQAAAVAKVESPRSLVHSLRVIKSPAEIELMRKACTIASKSFQEVMKFSKPGISEAHLYAKMEFDCKMLGSQYLAYPPVVAGGNRANTIHYINNNQLVEDGEMVLMDAGCEYHGYSSDITRTWPINGTFSPRQRDLYEALLEVQTTCISMCYHNCVTMDQIYIEMLRLIGQQLQRLSIVPSHVTAKQLPLFARQFCPHHVSHYLGMDVHDTDEISRNLLLQPGMIITIEPGIYIDQHRADVAKEWRGIGLRIEDDILITETEPQNLCAECPKELDEIEQLMRNKD